MIADILNMIFSIQYLVLGILVAALLDISIHFTKSSERLTFLEIWGCIVFWPIILMVFVVSFVRGE